MEAASRALSSTSSTRRRWGAAGDSRAVAASACMVERILRGVFQPRSDISFRTLRICYRLPLFHRQVVADFLHALDGPGHLLGPLLAVGGAGHAVEGDHPVLGVHVDLEHRKV